MTVKEIAQAVGKPERTVHDWTKATSAKSAEISAKIAQARATSRPAHYTLAESCLIIEEGLGKAAADVYRTNAAHAEMEKRASAPASRALTLSASMVANLMAIYGKTEAAKRIDHIIGYPSAGAASSGGTTPERKALPSLSDIPEGQRLLNLTPPRSASPCL